MNNPRTTHRPTGTTDRPTGTTDRTSGPVIELSKASIEPLWTDLDLTLNPGEWLTVLGPNGVGKSTLLGALTGTRKLTSGQVHVNGTTGFIPQQRMFSPTLPLRARDIVGLSGGHGIFRRRRLPAAQIDEALNTVDAAHLANRRIGHLSGGQQQLIRQASAIATHPDILLCDEPLLSLDYAAQKQAIRTIDAQRRDHNTAVVFVTHTINPVIDVTDRVLYLAPNGHTIGTIDDVITTDVLSELYGTHVDVVHVNSRLVIV